MKFDAIESQKSEYPVTVLCRVLDVSKSGYYEWRAAAEKRKEREIREQQLVRKIEAIHLGSKNCYGSPRVSDRLGGLTGVNPVSESTVARRMRKYKIRSKLKKKFKVTTDSNHKLPVAPNHLMQDFSAYQPDQIWMSDLTYVWTHEGWLYICGIIDLYSKKIVGWAASHRMTKELVITAYMRARQKRKPGRWLIFHSDRGSQYASHDFAGLLRKHGVIQSMSRRGNCWDSAPIESFWARLKTECVYWEDFKSRQDALSVISDWIENDYNVTRAHSALGYATPTEVEQDFELDSASGKV
jgi:transposase InsO family protein